MLNLIFIYFFFYNLLGKQIIELMEDKEVEMIKNKENSPRLKQQRKQWEKYKSMCILIDP